MNSEELIIIVKTPGLIINYNRLANLVKKYTSWDKIYKYLTIKNITKFNNRFIVKEMLLYRIITGGDEKYFCTSRFSKIGTFLKSQIPNLTLKYINKSIQGNDIIISDNCIDLYENQDIVIEYLKKEIFNINRINMGNSSCILVMDTGTGKTYTAGAFIEYFKKQTLIIVPKKNVLDEWTKMLLKCYPSIIIGEYHSDKKINPEADVMLMCIKSAIKPSFTFNKKTYESTEFLKRYGFVIYDEVHNTPTDINSEILWKLTPQYSIGITATPADRLDNFDSVYYRHLGKVIKASDIPGFNVISIVWKGHVKVIKYSGPDTHTKAIKNIVGSTNFGAMVQQFESDPYRNMMIMKYVLELYNDNKNIFIFAEHRDYCEKLLELLQKNININEIGILYGGVSGEEKINVEQKRIIIITYGTGMESLSIPRMDSIIFATPRRNKLRQTLGRILRISGDTTIERLIIDIIDVKTSIKSQFTTRKQIYDEKNFKIETIIDNYNNYM